MCERRQRFLRVKFDRELKLGFYEAKINIDAGLLAYRELEESLGLSNGTNPLLYGENGETPGLNLRVDRIETSAKVLSKIS